MTFAFGASAGRDSLRSRSLQDCGFRRHQGFCLGLILFTSALVDGGFRVDAAADSGLNVPGAESERATGWRSWWGLGLGFLVSASGLAAAAWMISRRRTEAEFRERERERVAAALDESEHRFRTLAEASFEGIAISERGLLLDCNEQLAQLAGRPRAELIGESVMNLVAPADRALVQEVLHRGRLEPYEHRMQRSDGTIFPVEARARSVVLGGRQLRITAVRDVTDRHRAEEALRESATRLQTVVNGAPIVLYSFDRDGVFTLSEGKGLWGLGLKPGEIVGRTVFEVYGDQPLAIGALRRALAGETFVEELSFPAGGTFEVSHTAIRDAAGRYAGTIGMLVDITQRKHAEQALRQEQEFVRALLETMVDGVVACDAEGKLALFNRTAREWHGMGLELLPQGSWASSYGLYGEDETSLLPAEAVPLVRAYRGERLRDLPMVIRAEGQPIRHVACNCSSFTDGEGRRLGAVAVMRDMTEARRVQSALSESEARFRQVVEASPLPLGISGPDGRIEYINPRFQEVFGYAPEEIPRIEDWFRLAYPDPAYRETVGRRWTAALAAANLQHPSSETIDVRITCKDGAVRVTQVFGSAMGARLLVVFNDLTAHHQVEEQLRESESRYRLLFESNPMALYVYDSESLRFLAVNDATVDRYGYTREELLGMTIKGLRFEEDVPMLLQDLNQGAKTRFYHSGEWRHRAKDGRTIDVEITTHSLEFDGRAARLVLANDITEQKRAERKLRASLEEKTALLKEVHHRVKNNLQIVSSLLNLQSGRVENPEVLGALADTQGRVRSMALLHEMLYRSESLARVDLASYTKDLCAQVMRTMGRAAERVKVDCELTPIECGLEHAVPCGLILNELVSNALKHAFPAGRSGRITVSLTRSDGFISMAVADDGVGLPAGLDLARSATLGLRLVQLLAVQLNGGVSVETQSGSVFRVKFPNC